MPSWFDTHGLQPSEGQPSAGQNYQQTFMGIVGNGMATPEALVAKEQQLAAAGIKVLRNGAGIAGKVQLPTGEIIDVIQSAGTGGGVAPFGWQQGHGGPTGEGGKPLPGNQFYGQPYGHLQGSMGNGGGTLGAAMGGGIDYKARMGALQDTPGYQFVKGEVLGATERSAASKGTLLTGGHQKDLQDRAAGLASTEFDNEYRRLFGMAELGGRAADSIGQYGSSYGDNATNLITGAGDARAQSSVASGNAWNNAFGGVGNTLTNAWMYNQYMNRPQSQTPGLAPMVGYEQNVARYPFQVPGQYYNTFQG